MDNCSMDKYERRRERLAQLIQSRCGGVSALFARTIERDASYVARMLYPEGKPGRKRIADDMMEIIEKAFDLPRGWLDDREASPEPVDTPSAPQSATTQDNDELVEVRAKILAELAGEVSALWIALPAERRTALLQQLRAEAGHQPGEARTLAPLKQKPASATRPATKARPEAG